MKLIVLAFESDFNFLPIATAMPYHNFASAKIEVCVDQSRISGGMQKRGQYLSDSLKPGPVFPVTSAHACFILYSTEVYCVLAVSTPQPLEACFFSRTSGEEEW